MVLMILNIFLALVALSQLFLFTRAIVINDFSKKDMRFNNLNLPCDLDSNLDGGLIIIEPDGVRLCNHCPWSERFAEPNKKDMDISDKALLIKSSVYDECWLKIHLRHGEFKESMGSSKCFRQDLPQGVGEFILPFTNDQNWDPFACAYRHAESISFYNLRRYCVDIEQIEFVNYSGEDKERLVWTKAYMERRRKSSLPPLNLWITNGAQVFEETYSEVMNMNYATSPLKAVFIDRHAQGDQTTEFFSLLSQEIFNPDNGFFTYSEETKCFNINPQGDSQKFYENLPGTKKLKDVNQPQVNRCMQCLMTGTKKLKDVNQPQVYRFIGRIIGQALTYRHVLDGDLSGHLIKAILNMEITLTDVASFDPGMYKLLSAFIHSNTSDNGSDTGGEDTHMTGDEDAHEYVQQLIRQRYIDPVKEQISDIRQGILDVVPKSEQSIASSVVDFSRRISGRAEVSQEEWEKWTYYQAKGYTKRDDQVRWFWNTVARLDERSFKKFFRIVFGFNRLPFVGFQGLLPQVFVLSKATPVDAAAKVDEQVPEVVADSARLKKILIWKPKISAAWNLRIPPYSSQEVFDSQIRAFIESK